MVMHTVAKNCINERRIETSELNKQRRLHSSNVLLPINKFIRHRESKDGYTERCSECLRPIKTKAYIEQRLLNTQNILDKGYKPGYRILHILEMTHREILV
jgi:hypothetical protein